MDRDGNHQQLGNVDIALKLQAGLGCVAPEEIGRRAHPLIFQQMDQPPQRPVVGSKMNRPFKCRSLARTLRAAGVAKCGVSPAKQISADIAAGQQDRLNGFYAGGANRKS